MSTAPTLGFFIDGPAALFGGAAVCKVSNHTYQAHSGSPIGLTDNGVTISYQAMTHRISGDEYGGNEGMPAEQLILGGQATIRTTIVKWGDNVGGYLMTGANTIATPGEVPRVGSPYFYGGYGFSFWVVGAGGVGYYFPKCELATQPKTWNVSSTERRMDITITAYNVFCQANSTLVTFLKGTDSFNFDADCTTTIFRGS